jgi:hypothetical protein
MWKKYEEEEKKKKKYRLSPDVHRPITAVM